MDVEMERLGSSQYSGQDLYMQPGSPEEADEGWVSWAWSFIPAIVGEDEEGEEGLYQARETRDGHNPLQLPCKDPIVSIGFYCTKASITFKVRQLLKKTN